RKAYQTMFSGSNLVISVVGDFDSDHAMALASQGFGWLKKGTPVTVGEVRDEPAKEKRPIFVDKEQEQITYNTGWLTCSVRDPDYVPLRAAVALMGDKVF